MGLGEHCTSDVSAGVCSVFGSQTESDTCECTCPSTNTGAIVGAIVALATLIILRSCRGKFSLHNTEESVFLEITFSIPHNYMGSMYTYSLVFLHNYCIMIILLQFFRYDSYLPMSPVTGLHITMNTNTAYNLGTQRGVAGGEGEAGDTASISFLTASRVGREPRRGIIL